MSPSPKRSSAGRIHAFGALFAFLTVLGILLPWSAGSADDRTTRTVDKTDLAMSRTIDEEVAARWKEKGLTPSELSDDAEFLRRATLDLTGMLPEPDEVLRFLADRSKDKRAHKIDELLGRPEYGEHFANTWLTILIGNDLLGRITANGAIRPWLVNAFNVNMPYDRFVREFIAAEGVSDQDGATNYVIRFDQQMLPIEMAGSVSRLFLGVQIQCAQCHNHPYEKWTQDQFHQFAAFFSRTRVSRIQEPGQRRQGFLVREDLRGEYNMPDTNPPRRMSPVFLTGDTIQAGPAVNRRLELAKLITSRENPWFARMIVNRYWSIFQGRGLVDPIDDFGDSNPPTHPELLTQLANDFVSKGYDLKYLCRVILNSRSYQLSSRTNATNREDMKYYSHQRLRPLSPDQLLNSLAQASGIEERAALMDAERFARLKMQILQRFIFVFGNDEGQEAVDFEGTIPQALMMLNGKLSNDAIRSASNMNLARILRDIDDPGERIDRIYLTTLARRPSDAERKGMLEYVRRFANAPSPAGNEQPFSGMQGLDRGRVGRGGGDGKRDGKGGGRPAKPIPGAVPYEDVQWALLNSTEFLFNR